MAHSYQAKASSASKTERGRSLEMDYLDLAFQNSPAARYA